MTGQANVPELAQRYYPLKAIATYLGLSEKTLYAWAEEGKIPAHKMGRVWRFDKTEIDAFAHRGAHSATMAAAHCGVGRTGAL